MEINSPDPRKIVDDYDFVFTSGMLMPLTIDVSVGDTIVFGDSQVMVRLVAKPSMNDPDKLLSAEDIVIYTTHLASVQHREREMIKLTVDAQAEWVKAIKELSGTIQ